MLIDRSEQHRYACGVRHKEDLTNTQKRGEALRYRKSLRAKRRRGKISVLDFPPEEDRPRGYTEEEDPIVGL